MILLPPKRLVLITLTILLWTNSAIFASVQLDINAPDGSGEDFTDPEVLANGNIVMVDPDYTPPGPLGGALGAVYLFNGSTGALISIMTGTTPGDSIGRRIVALPNGDFVVGSDNFDGQKGAATLCSGITGCPSQINSANSLVGSTAGDQIGRRIRALENGNFVTYSTNWDNGAATDAGAVTYCNAAGPCAGVVDASNSLVGTTADDKVGDSFTGLSDGDYVISTETWDDGATANVGAAVWCSGTAGCAGPVTTANSLHGTTAEDGVGGAITPLSNGAYSVRTFFWQESGTVSTGAVTFCPGPTGCVGSVSASNSLIGSNDNDLIGQGGTHELPGGQIVVASPSWTNGSLDRAGAVTFCLSIASCNGVISTANSMVGSTAQDLIGVQGIAVLANGNYVVKSPSWQNGSSEDRGAATFCSGTAGCTGTLDTADSLIGTGIDRVGGSILELPGGNYAVVSSGWSSNAGAVTFCDGTTGCTGMTVSAANSLVGFTGNRIGNFGNLILSNGNFVINSPNGGNVGEGAITFCSGTTGCPTGQISSSNSLFGSNTGQGIGDGGIYALDNGNYIVVSRSWDRFITPLNKLGTTIDNAGAVTFCDGTSGCTGFISDSNSLVGSTLDDGENLEAEVIGDNYVAIFPRWDDGGLNDSGAVVFCDGTTGCSGAVSPGNALVGSQSSDQVGSDGIRVFANGDYAVISDSYSPPPPLKGDREGGSPSTGAVTYGNGTTGTTGTINSQNSVLGTTPSNNFNVTFDPVNQQMVVGRTADEIVTLFRNTTPQAAPYDFDGDGRTDVSVFRPSEGNWYLSQTTDGFAAINWGLAGDELSPADFDGDGKTDIAVWRPGPPMVARFYILNSSDFSVTDLPFGQTGDNPVVVGDWDGDGQADPAVYRDSASGSQSRFYYLGSDNNPGNNITFLDWGNSGDKPAKGDFDGDGKQDQAIFRPSTNEWWIKNSSDSSISVTPFGLAADVLVPGDYDGDGKTDLAIFRESEQTWYHLRSVDLTSVKFQWFLAGDLIAPGDYDGDGKIDPTVFRPSDQTWYIAQSGSGSPAFEVFGQAGDVPVPSASVTQ